MNKKKMFTANKNEKGVSIYLSVMMVAILLAIILGLDTILVGQMTTVRQIGYSAAAFYAADAGIESALYNIKQNNDLGDIDSTPFGTASYSVEILSDGEGGCDTGAADYVCVISTGTYKETTRVIEIKAKKADSFVCGDLVTYPPGTQNPGGPVGGSYHSVEITLPGGTKQCWLGEDLNIGSPVPYGSQSDNQSIDKTCFENIEANCISATTSYDGVTRLRGALYTHNEAMTSDGESYNLAHGPADEKKQGICPPGWHIPTAQEWWELDNSLKNVGGTCKTERYTFAEPHQCNNVGCGLSYCYCDEDWDCDNAGNKLKMWKNSNTSGYDTCSNQAECGISGFNMVLGGNREYGGVWSGFNSLVYYWSSTYVTPMSHYQCQRVQVGKQGAKIDYCNENSVFPVRCIKD